MMIWCDVEDLFEYARSRSRPSGIQRLAYEVYVALRALAGEQLGFVRQDPLTGALRVVDWQDVDAVYAHMGSAAPAPRPRRASAGPIVPPALNGLARRVPDDLRLPLGQAARGQVAAIRGIVQAIGAIPKLLQPRGPGANPVYTAQVTGRPLQEVARAGDILAVLGSPWSHPDYPAMVAELGRTTGLRFALLVYDFIPAVRPEYCAPSTVPAFLRFMRGCLPLADFIFAISKATAHDLTRWAEQARIPLRSPARPIPIGTEFVRAAADAPLPGGLVPGGYALFVSTLEARKNHLLAFRAWRRLLEELPAEQVPMLVFAGRVGWMVADLLQQIENSKWLDGKLVLIDDADDATLAALYAGARFTLFPSLYEGWGLPVSESLAFGKVCLASDRSSVPEAGGPFCLYHDPDSVTEAVALYRRMLDEPGTLRALEQRIASDYRRTAWSATAQAILDAVGGTGRAPAA